MAARITPKNVLPTPGTPRSSRLPALTCRSFSLVVGGRNLRQQDDVGERLRRVVADQRLAALGDDRLVKCDRFPRDPGAWWIWSRAESANSAAPVVFYRGPSSASGGGDRLLPSNRRVHRRRRRRRRTDQGGQRCLEAPPRLKTLKFTGFGHNYSVGQSRARYDAWLASQVRATTSRSALRPAGVRLDITREQGAICRAAACAFTGEQRQIQVVRGTDAWDDPIPPAPDAGRRGGGPPPAAEPGRITLQDALRAAGVRPPGPPPVMPQPAAAAERAMQILLTPHGFLKAATANHATTKKVPTGTEVSFTAGRASRGHHQRPQRGRTITTGSTARFW